MQINRRCIDPFVNSFVILASVFVLSGCAAQSAMTTDAGQAVQAEKRAGTPSSEGRISAEAEARESEVKDTVMCLCEQ